MAISTYAELKTAVATWLNRSNLTALIPDFITLAETRIHYGSQEPPLQSDPLRIRAMEESVFASFSTQRVLLPARFLQARRFYLNSNPIRSLDLITTDNFWDTYISSQSGPPKQFTIEGETLVLGPSPDASYTGELLYYRAFASLSDDTDTNWLLQNAPGAYLHGALIEAHAFARNAQEAQLSYGRFMGIINSLMMSDKQDRYSGSPWVARTDVGNP